MFQHNHTDHDIISTPLPQLVSKFSKNSDNSKRFYDKEINKTNEDHNLPNFMNLKFQNIFLKEKQAADKCDNKEKKVIFSKFNLGNNNDELNDKQILNSELKYVNKATSTSESVNQITNRHVKNNSYSNFSVSKSLKKPLAKRDQFKTTIEYYKYLIENNEYNRRLNTNFIVKDHFLFFSKKLKNNSDEIKVPDSYVSENDKNKKRNIRSNSTVTQLNFNYARMKTNYSNVSNRMLKTDKRIISTNKKNLTNNMSKIIDLKSLNESRSNKENLNLRDYTKKNFVLKNKFYKLKFNNAEIQ